MSDYTAQHQFFFALCRWGLAAEARGYLVTGGDYYRDPRATFPYSSPRSYHARRLAFDPNLFRDGVYLTTVEQWREMGELWESLGGTWGGRWSNGDANHLSWGEGR
jgi:hypothetical protein